MQTELITRVRAQSKLSNRWVRQFIRFALALAVLGLTALARYGAARHAEFVEAHYSRGLYPILSQAVNALFRWFPFSVAEYALYGLSVALTVYVLVQLILLVIRRQRILRITAVIINLVLIASFGYFLFNGLWGLNYYREPLAQSLGYEVTPRSVSELRTLCANLAAQANDQRAQVQEDLHGYMLLPEGKRAALQKVPAAYRMLAQQYDFFGARYGAPKPVLLSLQMSYTDIEGIYIPFTAEPNLNMDMPDGLFLSAACHEVAHEYGFAREDEANFIAYLACQASGDEELMYSGTLLALIHSMNALYGFDPDAFSKIAATYSNGLKRDIKYQSLYWDRFKGPVAETSNKVNNAYLKSNNQSDGVNSYGRMVDLLLAQQEKEKSDQN